MEVDCEIYFLLIESGDSKKHFSMKWPWRWFLLSFIKLRDLLLKIDSKIPSNKVMTELLQKKLGPGDIRMLKVIC